MLVNLNIVELFYGIYKTCECGCNKLIPFLTKGGKPARFMYHHNIRGKYQRNNTGENHGRWKGGRFKRNGYWRIWLPDYYRSYHDNYCLEHVYFYQEYNKCCVLPWCVVHHIDGNTENNMPWNLMVMTKSAHMSYHKKGNRHWTLRKTRNKKRLGIKKG